MRWVNVCLADFCRQSHVCLFFSDCQTTLSAAPAMTLVVLAWQFQWSSVLHSRSGDLWRGNLHESHRALLTGCTLLSLSLMLPLMLGNFSGFLGPLRSTCVPFLGKMKDVVAKRGERGGDAYTVLLESHRYIAHFTASVKMTSTRCQWVLSGPVQ